MKSGFRDIFAGDPVLGMTAGADLHRFVIFSGQLPVPIFLDIGTEKPGPKIMFVGGIVYQMASPASPGILCRLAINIFLVRGGDGKVVFGPDQR